MSSAIWRHDWRRRRIWEGILSQNKSSLGNVQATPTPIETLRPRQNGHDFAEDTFKHIFLNENVRITIQISLKFVPKGPINNVLALVQIMACRLVGAKSLSEPMMVRLLTHICITRPQWVNQQSPATMNKSKSLPELHQQCNATWERDLGNHQKYNRETRMKWQSHAQS